MSSATKVPKNAAGNQVSRTLLARYAWCGVAPVYRAIAGTVVLVASKAIRSRSCAATASLPLRGENAKLPASVGFAPLSCAASGYYGFPRRFAPRNDIFFRQTQLSLRGQFANWPWQSVLLSTPCHCANRPGPPPQTSESFAVGIRRRNGMSEAWRLRRAEGYAVSADVVAIRIPLPFGVCSAPAGAGDFWPRPQKSPKGPLRNRGFLRTSLALCVVRCRSRIPRDCGNAGDYRFKSNPFLRLLSLSLCCARRRRRSELFYR